MIYTFEVLATQGNVINSIKVFWNKLKAKLAYAVTRPSYDRPVGGNYVPIFVNADGVAQECQPTTVNTGIGDDGIITIPAETIPTENIYTGTTVCINVSSNSASNSDNSLQIQHNNDAAPVRYPSGVTVMAKDISGGELLLATFCKTGSTNFWILLNRINTVVSTGQTTDGNVSGGSLGLMTAKDKAKLDTIAWGANAYRLPAATDKDLGGVQLGYTGNGQNYSVQKDGNNNLFVNVPWTDTDTHYTALLKVGGTNSKENQITTNGNTYLQIVEADRVTSQRLIKGAKSVSVTSDSNGAITISGPDEHIILKTEGRIANNSTNGAYYVAGPGSEKANTTNYLRGDGSWGAPVASMGRMTASITGGTQTPGGGLSATLQVTYNGSPIQFAFIGSSYKVSSSDGSLYINGDVKTSFTIEKDNTALIVPIGNLSLKPQILHFKSTTEVVFMD